MHGARSGTTSSSLLASVTGAKVAETETKFLRFDTIAQIMTLFIEIVAPYFDQVTGRLAQTILVSIIVLFIGLTRLGCIDSGGRGRAFLLALSLINFGGGLSSFPAEFS